MHASAAAVETLLVSTCRSTGTTGRGVTIATGVDMSPGERTAIRRVRTVDSAGDGELDSDGIIHKGTYWSIMFMISGP